MLKICEQKELISKNDYYEIKYEDLLYNPSKYLYEIANFLDVTSNELWLKESSAIPKPFYLFKMDQQISNKKYQEVYSKIANTMKKFGYPLDEKYYKALRLKEIWRSLDYGKQRLFTFKEKFFSKIKKQFFQN